MLLFIVMLKCGYPCVCIVPKNSGILCLFFFMTDGLYSADVDSNFMMLDCICLSTI